jgi:hypothetical protein
VAELSWWCFAYHGYALPAGTTRKKRKEEKKVY